jgi:transcriptional regulator with XRE-family HTH domain
MNAEMIGKRLVHLRGAKSREEVAGSVGISLSALAMYELGNRIPRDEIKIALSHYYGVSVQSLFFD